MYGVVLMMALSGGADLPALNDVNAEPAARYGDHGTKAYRLFGGRRGHGCCGGGGGCHGGAYYGGCHGGGYYGGCSGSWGGYGGCTGSWGGSGCCGGHYGSYGSWDGGYYGTMPYEGSYGSSTYYGGTPYGGGYQYGWPFEGERRYEGDRRLDDGARGRDVNPSGDENRGRNVNPNRGGDRTNPPEARGAAPATLVVSLPTDATLTVEGTPTRSTSGLRTFVSPPLDPGRDYTYTLRAQVTRDGKTVERTKDVSVRAGHTSEVRFDFGTSTTLTGE